MNNLKALGIRVLLALGMLLVLAMASVDTPASVSAHGGDTTLVHLCVNDANAETLTVFPLPIGNANIDCVNPPWPLGPGWSPVDVGAWSGAGTGSFSPVNLTDNVGIGTTSPAAILQVRDKPIDSGLFTAETDAGALIKSLNDNGGSTLAPPETAFILAREGISGEAFANFARFDLRRYEVPVPDLFESRTQLDIRLTHGPLNAEGNNPPTILSLQSGGNVGIGTATPKEQLEITGNFRLPPSTATTGLIKSGGDRYIHNGGSFNFFAGVNSGNLTASGFGHNTGVGVIALESTTTGFLNTAVGARALRLQTTAGDNTAVGALALELNTGGENNTAVGRSALGANTTGIRNTAVGREALISNTTGSNNTAIGFLATLVRAI